MKIFRRTENISPTFTCSLVSIKPAPSFIAQNYREYECKQRRFLNKFLPPKYVYPKCKVSSIICVDFVICHFRKCQVQLYTGNITTLNIVSTMFQNIKHSLLKQSVSLLEKYFLKIFQDCLLADCTGCSSCQPAALSARPKCLALK